MVKVLKTEDSITDVIEGLKKESDETTTDIITIDLSKTIVEYIQNDAEEIPQLGSMIVVTNGDGEPTGAFKVIIRENPGMKASIPAARVGFASIINTTIRKSTSESVTVIIQSSSFRNEKEMNSLVCSFTELCLVMAPDMPVNLVITDIVIDEDVLLVSL